METTIDITGLSVLFLGFGDWGFGRLVRFKV